MDTLRFSEEALDWTPETDASLSATQIVDQSGEAVAVLSYDDQIAQTRAEQETN